VQPIEPGTGRSIRLAVVAVGLLALLAVVAFASRSGFGHQSQAKPTPGYVSYAFTAFLIVFVLAIPFAIYSFIIQAREGQIARKSFKSRVIANTLTMFFFGALAFIIIYLKHHHGNLFDVNVKGLNPKGRLRKPGAHGKRAAYEPEFEWSIFWIAVAIALAGGGWFVWRWRQRKRRSLVPLELKPSVAEDFAASIGDAIDDLEAEPDARRAVIAAYARMEGVLTRHGLRRLPSETSLEYLRRVLIGLTARGEPVKRLTSLFEQAKFSRHEIDGSMKHDAIGALREIRDDLQATS
jgi:hypothetical protein